MDQDMPKPLTAGTPEFDEMLAAASSQTHNAFQRLTFILERKGLLTREEMAEIYDEQLDPE
jgi:hypothetical protein